MVFKNFRFQVIFRVLLLAAVISVLAWCLVYEYYLRSIYVAAAVAIITGELIWYVDRFNRDVKTFMEGLLQRDCTMRYPSAGKSKTYDELYDTLNRISYAFKRITAEKEVQFRYLEMLVEHLRIGILSLDEEGKIQLANQAAKDLLQKDVLFNLKALGSLDPLFVNTLTDLRSGETRLVKLRIGADLLQLSTHASEFKLEDRYYKLISMQNIRNELDAREMEAWQKLIRVLTHEIMNSVSPLISLSETMHGLVTRQNKNESNGEGELLNTLDKGLEAIKIRSQGLYHFTQSYRKLTGIPKLALQQASLRDIVARVMILMTAKLEERGINFSVSSPDISVVVDPELMEHVLINLLVNAMEAVSATQQPRIDIVTSRDPRGSVNIYVRDNGEGMDEATAEKIFIPFFTTRKNGSGIGLALAKQILQLHHADIQFTSEKGKGTEFVIVL
jgi:nitrogen fixation/metabolism regulation signal transduction histidine kinase